MKKYIIVPWKRITNEDGIQEYLPEIDNVTNPEILGMQCITKDPPQGILLGDGCVWEIEFDDVVGDSLVKEKYFTFTLEDFL